MKKDKWMLCQWDRYLRRWVHIAWAGDTMDAVLYWYGHIKKQAHNCIAVVHPSMKQEKCTPKTSS